MNDVTQILNAIESGDGDHRRCSERPRHLSHNPDRAAIHRAADVRVDQFSDSPDEFSLDWALEIGVGQVIGRGLASVPQVGIFADSLTQEWALFVRGTDQAFFFELIAVDEPVVLGQWYTVVLDLDAVNGIVRSKIINATTGELLLCRIDVINEWTALEGQYDLFFCYDSELSTGNTVGGIAVVDNIRSSGLLGDVNDDGTLSLADVAPFSTVLLDPSSATPAESCAADLNLAGAVDGLDVQPFLDELLTP